MKKPNPELIDRDNPEWTETDFQRAQPAAEVFPRAMHEKLGIRRRGPQKTPVKRMVTIRLSSEVVDGFKAGGPGWQGRVDSVLKEWLRAHHQS